MRSSLRPNSANNETVHFPALMAMWQRHADVKIMYSLVSSGDPLLQEGQAVLLLQGAKTGSASVAPFRLFATALRRLVGFGNCDHRHRRLLLAHPCNATSCRKGLRLPRWPRLSCHKATVRAGTHYAIIICHHEYNGHRGRYLCTLEQQEYLPIKSALDPLGISSQVWSTVNVDL